MKKSHKHAELIKQWADGAKIQSRRNDVSLLVCPPKHPDFEDDPFPEWSINRDYRIKPEPQCPKTSMSDVELENFFSLANGCKPTREVLRDIANGAIARAIHDEQVIIAPGQIEG